MTASCLCTNFYVYSEYNATADLECLIMQQLVWSVKKLHIPMFSVNDNNF